MSKRNNHHSPKQKFDFKSKARALKQKLTIFKDLKQGFLTDGWGVYDYFEVYPEPSPEDYYDDTDGWFFDHWSLDDYYDWYNWLHHIDYHEYGVTYDDYGDFDHYQDPRDWFTQIPDLKWVI